MRQSRNVPHLRGLEHRELTRSSGKDDVSSPALLSGKLNEILAIKVNCTLTPLLSYETIRGKVDPSLTLRRFIHSITKILLEYARFALIALETVVAIAHCTCC